MLSPEAWVSRFTQQLKLQGFSELSIPDYVRNIRRFLNYLETRGIDRLTEVDRSVLADYQLEVSLERFRGKPLRSSTQKKRLTCLRQLFRYLLRQSAVLQDPTSDLEFPRLIDQLPRDVLSKREVGRLLSAADPQNLLGLRDRSILELLYSTGIRVSELAALNLQNLNLSDFSFERGELLIVNPKGKKDRLSPRSVGKIVLHAAQAGCVTKRISPHSFRHAMATRLLRNRANSRHIQAVLGHAQITST